MDGLLEFHCPGCGYSTDRMLVGMSPDPGEYDPVAVTCPRCRRLFPLHRPDVADGCPRCASPVRIEDTGARIRCPCCGTPMSVRPIARAILSGFPGKGG
jgi:hypothetical protein